MDKLDFSAASMESTALLSMVLKINELVDGYNELKGGEEE